MTIAKSGQGNTWGILMDVTHSFISNPPTVNNPPFQATF